MSISGVDKYAFLDGTLNVHMVSGGSYTIEAGVPIGECVRQTLLLEMGNGDGYNTADGRIMIHSKSGDGVHYNARLKIRNFVNDPPVGDKWWEETITHSRPTSQYSEVTMSPGIKSGDGTTVFKNRLTDLVIVPVVNSYSSDITYGTGATKIDTPYGYAHIHGFLILAQDGSNGWGATITSGTTYWYQDDLACVPLISEAEKAFLLGITKKTEPIPGA